MTSNAVTSLLLGKTVKVSSVTLRLNHLGRGRGVVWGLDCGLDFGPNHCDLGEVSNSDAVLDQAGIAADVRLKIDAVQHTPDIHTWYHVRRWTLRSSE